MKSEASAASGPESVLPAIGCPPMKDTDVGSISSAHCMTADLVLAVSVTIVPGFRCGAMSRNIVCIAITGVASITRCAVSTAVGRCLSILSTAPRF